MLHPAPRSSTLQPHTSRPLGANAHAHNPCDHGDLQRAGGYPPLVEEILSLGLGLDILIVNDNSPDGTGRIADDLASRHPEVSVLHRPGKLGLGTAYVAGFQHALARGYARVITMDADYSHHTRDLPEFLGKFETHDVVVGTRYITGGGVENWPPYLLALSRGGSLYTRLITGMPLHDATCGFNGFCVEVIRAIRPERIRSEGYSSEIETKFRSWEKGSASPRYLSSSPIARAGSRR